jgi:riboflavin biosynthesis pyrimidine reductase
VWQTGRTGRAAVVRAFMEMAREDGLQSVFVEGGQGLAAVFLQERLVNRVYLFYGNRILGGGVDGLRWGGGMPLNGAPRLSGMRTETFGEDIMVTGLVRWPAQ